MIKKSNLSKEELKALDELDKKQKMSGSDSDSDSDSEFDSQKSVTFFEELKKTAGYERNKVLISNLNLKLKTQRIIDKRIIDINYKRHKLQNQLDELHDKKKLLSYYSSD